MRAVRGDELLALPVRLHGIQLGSPVDLLLDREELCAVGIDVLCGDAVHRFLPLATATIAADEIAVRSPLVLREGEELAFYRTRTLALASVRGRPVARGDRTLGTLADVVVSADWSLVEIVVETPDDERYVPFDANVRFRPKSRTAA